MNQELNSKLSQQKDNLNKRNQEVTAMDKRVIELRDRLWKKKAALQQKENLPVSISKTTVKPDECRQGSTQARFNIQTFFSTSYPITFPPV